MSFHHALAALSLIAAGFGLYAGLSPRALVDDPILAIATPSLTTVKVAAATNEQDIRPLVGQRGTNLDGVVRAGPMQRMVIGGNPFENVWGAASVDAMRLDTGSYQLEEVDISLPAVVPWVVGRTYNAHQETSGAAHRDSDGFQGKNWFQMSQPEILFYDDPTSAANDLIYVVYGADRFVEYLRTDASSSTFRSRNGSAGIISFTAAANPEPETYMLVDQQGTAITFFGFDFYAGVAKGQIWKIVDADGNTAFVGDASTASAAITNGYTAQGRVSKAYDTADRRFTYAYDGTTHRLTQVKAETKTGGTWTSPSGVAEVAKVDYEYYGNETYGDTGGLKLVEVTTPLTDSGVSAVTKRYYRYWEGTYNSSTNPGHPYGLMYIVEPEGTRSQDWADSTFDEDFLTLSNANLEPYASAYFEYDSSHRVDLAWFNGECGCSGGSSGTYIFEYEPNGSFSDDTGAYDEEWKTRTVVERPNGSYLTQYFDEAHQPLSQVVTDDDPDNTGPAPSRWVTYVTRDAYGEVSSISTPANVTAYTHSSGAVTTSSSVGLVWSYTRSSSGTQRGFITEVKWKEGTSGTAFFDREYGYTTASQTLGDSNLIRPFQSTVHTYSVYKSTSTANRVTTTMTPTVYSGKVVPETVAISFPTVTTGENGSNGATTRSQYFDADGQLVWEKGEDAVITYREYTNGQLTRLIEDANTALTGSGQDLFGITIPSGFSSSGTPQHRKRTYAYDAQRRRSSEVEPDGRVVRDYFTKLADGRLVALTYNDFDAGTPKYYGPVHYTVLNHAGKVEVEATVALAGNESTTALTGHVDETDADPITAIDFGTVVRLTRNVYDETGTILEESRLYHEVPASGAGSDGTNYDATLYDYDDMGKRWRVKAPHGTIDRTVFDIQGRMVETWIGTNDSSFDGGEPSGTDNMVKTAEMEFDAGADDGNGHVTERTLFVEGSGTGSRVTSYTHDPLGNVLLETRPTAPHAFYKADGRGRKIATGLFSSTGSIVVGTDDPTTETANRLALSQTFFDPKGQVWKTTRHNIDASDGSDDDNLETLNWYDATGRLVKTDGAQFTKITYDRLGRETYEFVLAQAKASGGGAETAYADAGDVLYDIVLEEHQTVYESDDSDDVLLSVSISRFHDDFGGGETTGVLDTNADNDRFKVTAGDLEGRADITSFWYDSFGRLTGTVRDGTNGGGTYDRAALSVPPSRTDTELRTDNLWDIDGSLKEVTDPKGMVMRTLYDDVGRTVATIRNYVNGAPSAVTGDDDVYTRHTYADGLRTELWVDFDGDATKDGNDEVTTYTYGTVKGASAGDSKIATGHLLQKTTYPDSTSGTDVVTLAYNAQSQEFYKKDQAGNVLESEYDTSGRRTKLKATTVISGFDGAVKLIQSAFTSLGQTETVTSYDAVSSGTAVNEVKYAYDGWGNVASFKQDKDGTVGGSGFYEVAYTWAKATGGRNSLRKSGATLPSGATLTYDYISSGGRHDDAASRVSRILHGATNVVQYGYIGVAQLVGTDYRQPAIMWLLGSSGGSYSDLDIFNRVTSSRWTSDLTTDRDFFDLDIAYDRNSNITRVEDNVHVGFDWSYTMDNLDRLSNAQRGTWSGSITSEKEEQTWALMDQVGNWEHVKLDLTGDGDWGDAGEYDDDRTHNAVNELTARDTDDNGTDNYSLAYDAVGNLTDDAQSYEYVYDPFGRLRKINTQASALIAEYNYNGLGHMVAVHEDTDNDLDVDANDKWLYPVHDERWRMVANFRESDASPKEEWVNQEAGLDGRGDSSYINGVVLRNKDANTAWTSASDGTLEERVYICQNWRGDVSALVYSNGDQVEQVRYSPHGMPVGLPGGDTDSDGDCNHGDTADSDQIQTWINGVIYDVRGDLDLDGDVDSADKGAAQARAGDTLGMFVLSDCSNRLGYEGATHKNSLRFHRWRCFNGDNGRWTRRDPLGYSGGLNQYVYGASSPIKYRDPMGLQDIAPSWKPCAKCSVESQPSPGETHSPVCNFKITLKEVDQQKGTCYRLVTPILDPEHGLNEHEGPCGAKKEPCNAVVNATMSGTCPATIGLLVGAGIGYSHGFSWVKAGGSVGTGGSWSESKTFNIPSSCNNQAVWLYIGIFAIVPSGDLEFAAEGWSIKCGNCDRPG